ncbi:MAG: RAD55 family ATPase [Candidatus Heimdallarchaeota archaeon]|nr:RAD55 family ATPase [Candidatus Heimdallarchaeota archaeon]
MSIPGNIVHLRDLVGRAESEIFLIVGPPGAGKESFAIQYMLDGFANKMNGVYVTTDDFPEDITRKMKLLGSDPASLIKSKQLEFIDAFSYRTGESTDTNEMMVDDIRDLTGLSVMIKKMIDTKSNLRLVFNTISTISIYNSGVALLDFIQMQVARLKRKNHSGLIIAHEGIIDEKVIQGIKAFVDGVIEFQLSEDESGNLKRRVRVVFAPKIRKSGWVDLYQQL